MRFGLIGHPLGHSYSPLLHSQFGEYEYNLFDLEEDELDIFLRKKEFLGLNVTIPYKEKVIPYLDKKDVVGSQYFQDANGNISEGTIDNIYEEFSFKAEDTLLNITSNLLNGKYQHTDETVTKENGKDSYYRGYANKENVLYKYHNHKGDKPIEEDGILTDYFGTIITDHDTGMFKYGTNNQDCIIHFGRYCIEQKQNIMETSW